MGQGQDTKLPGRSGFWTGGKEDDPQKADMMERSRPFSQLGSSSDDNRDDDALVIVIDVHSASQASPRHFSQREIMTLNC